MGMQRTCTANRYMFQGMVAVMEEIWEKQEESELVMPLKTLGNWELLYGDGLVFRYPDYDATSRSVDRQPECMHWRKQAMKKEETANLMADMKRIRSQGSSSSTTTTTTTTN